MTLSDLAAADMTCSMAWSVWTRLRGMLNASSSAILRNPCSTASRASSIVRSWSTSSSVSSNTPMTSLAKLLRSQPRLEAVESALQLLAAGGIRQPHVALGAKRRAGYQIDVCRLQRRAAEAGRVGDLVPVQRAAEVGGDVKESIERAAR